MTYMHYAINKIKGRGKWQNKLQDKTENMSVYAQILMKSFFFFFSNCKMGPKHQSLSFVYE